jgi:hypothetical protein
MNQARGRARPPGSGGFDRGGEYPIEGSHTKKKKKKKKKKIPKNSRHGEGGVVFPTYLCTVDRLQNLRNPTPVGERRRKKHQELQLVEGS